MTGTSTIRRQSGQACEVCGYGPTFHPPRGQMSPLHDYAPPIEVDVLGGITVSSSGPRGYTRR